MQWVTTDVKDDVATITLNDPKRKNALSPELGDAFAAAVLGANARAIVVRGEGGNFSSGGDFNMLQRLRGVSHDEAKQFMLGFYARFLCVNEVDVPVIAYVEGYAIGAGFCLALACDHIVIAPSAKVALNFAKLGLGPGLGATVNAARLFGEARAYRMLATGETIDGSQVPTTQGTLETAMTLARQMAANAPIVVRQLKQRPRLREALDREAEAQAVTYRSKDLGEGLAAAKEKRAPRFEGA